MPIAASENSTRPRRGPAWITLRPAIGRVASVPIRSPFGDVSCHVKNAERRRTGRERSNSTCPRPHRARSTPAQLRCGHRVTPRENSTINSPRGVLPLCFRRECRTGTPTAERHRLSPINTVDRMTFSTCHSPVVTRTQRWRRAGGWRARCIGGSGHFGDINTERRQFNSANRALIRVARRRAH